MHLNIYIKELKYTNLVYATVDAVAHWDVYEPVASSYWNLHIIPDYQIHYISILHKLNNSMWENINFSNNNS